MRCLNAYRHECFGRSAYCTYDYIRKITGNYFSKRFIVTMWKIVLLRLIIPINLPITFGIAKPFIGMVRGAKNILGGLLEVKISPEYIMQQGHQ